MIRSRIKLLRNMPLFYSLEDEALEIILSDADTVTLEPGEFFFRQGDDAHYMYVLESGSVSIHKAWQDREMCIGNLGPGDCFGEMALIESSVRSASVRAETACSAVEISPLGLQALMENAVEQYILVQSNIARELCRRLRMADESRMLVVDPHPKVDEQDLSWPPIS